MGGGSGWGWSWGGGGVVGEGMGVWGWTMQGEAKTHNPHTSPIQTVQYEQLHLNPSHVNAFMQLQWHMKGLHRSCPLTERSAADHCDLWVLVSNLVGDHQIIHCQVHSAPLSGALGLQQPSALLLQRLYQLLLLFPLPPFPLLHVPLPLSSLLLAPLLLHLLQQESQVWLLQRLIRCCCLPLLLLPLGLHLQQPPPLLLRLLLRQLRGRRLQLLQLLQLRLELCKLLLQQGRLRLLPLTLLLLLLLRLGLWRRRWGWRGGRGWGLRLRLLLLLLHLGSLRLLLLLLWLRGRLRFRLLLLLQLRLWYRLLLHLLLPCLLRLHLLLRLLLPAWLLVPLLPPWPQPHVTESLHVLEVIIYAVLLPAAPEVHVHPNNRAQPQLLPSCRLALVAVQRGAQHVLQQQAHPPGLGAGVEQGDNGMDILRRIRGVRG